MIFQERTYGVLIVSASARFAETTEKLLPVTDYYPVVTVTSTSEARRRLLEKVYDIVLIHTPLKDEFGSQLAVDICQSSNAGALLFVRSDIYDDVYAKVMDKGVMVLPVPTSPQIVSQTMRIMCAARERLRHLEEKQSSIEDAIEEIRIMNRAKWILMERDGITEKEAHKAIEKISMDRRISRRAVSEEIIMGED